MAFLTPGDQVKFALRFGTIGGKMINEFVTPLARVVFVLKREFWPIVKFVAVLFERPIKIILTFLFISDIQLD